MLSNLDLSQSLEGIFGVIHQRIRVENFNLEYDMEKQIHQYFMWDVCTHLLYTVKYLI